MNGSTKLTRRLALAVPAALLISGRGNSMILKRDDAFRVVCSIRTPTGGGKEDVGTGSFISRDNDPYLVTASHVAKGTNAGTYIVLSDDRGKAQNVSLALFGGAFKEHPIADISVMRITANSSNMNILQKRFYPYSQLNLTNSPPSRDDELTSVGFPQGFGDRGLFSPLTFRSHASSGFIMFNRFDTKTPCDFLILENPSVAGYSGCPLFDLGYMVSGNMTQTIHDTICHGFMHGTINDETGGKMAAITPAYYIKDLI